MSKSNYAVYVSDSNGWGPECPDSEGVFFGRHAGAYVRWPYLLEDGTDARMSMGDHGFVIFGSHAEAVAFRRELDRSGDWIAPGEDEESRPSYAVRKLNGSYV